MKLTSEQIDQLYTFTRQHYVEWYDVQTELVDHLANAIEAEWEVHPILSFEEVLNQEFKKFGIFGFMDVIVEKQKFLSKKYESMIWSYYKEFFKLPTIILTFCAILILYNIANFWIYGKYLILFLLLTSFIWGFSEAFMQNRNIKITNSKTGKKWLFENMIQSNLPFIFFLIFNTFQFRHFFSIGWTPLYYSISSTLLVVFVLYIYVRVKVIPPLVSQELAKSYPDYVS